VGVKPKSGDELLKPRDGRGELVLGSRNPNGLAGKQVTPNPKLFLVLKEKEFQ